MDFPVEATVHLSEFQDDAKVRELLRSHDFQLKDLSGDRVRVKGLFVKLKAVKVRLEQLRQNQAEAPPRPSSSFSSGATSRYDPDVRPKSAGDRGRLGSMDRPLHARPSSPHTSAPRVSDLSSPHTYEPRVSDLSSPHKSASRVSDLSSSFTSASRVSDLSSPHTSASRVSDLSSPHTSAPRVSDPSHAHQISSPHRAAVSTGKRESEAFRASSEVLLVDYDVYKYAEQFKNKDFDMILENHNVKMRVEKVSESVEITLLGKNARMAGGKLQSIFTDLSQSLRTQEVLLRDMDREGKAFLEKILRNNNVVDSVLVCERHDRLHLIGSSSRSFQVKQKLLGGSVEQSGRAGRTMDRNSVRRSGSLPPVKRQSSDTGGSDYSSPAGAAGYSPSNYRDDKQEGAKPVRAAGARPPSGASSRRSSSTSRVKTREEKPPDVARVTSKKSKAPGIKLALLNSKSIELWLKRTKKK